MIEFISSLKNPKVTLWKSLKERKGRRESGCFLVEGRKMTEEALASAFPVEAVLVDMVLENINTHKYFHIITTKPAEIEAYITGTLKRGATELHGEGAYTHEGRTVLLTVMKRHEAVLLRRYVKRVDPHAFVLIINTGEIVGKGFLSN